MTFESSFSWPSISPTLNTPNFTPFHTTSHHFTPLHTTTTTTQDAEYIGAKVRARLSQIVVRLLRDAAPVHVSGQCGGGCVRVYCALCVHCVCVRALCVCVVWIVRVCMCFANLLSMPVPVSVCVLIF